ncbi:MAG: hypothetical protein H6710_14790 [Myxococcales bacterium]|nr:hypothetical protein [Myxococcales bacterium]MCB9702058.1 hypothetical protein [Myxococcales bacterium]
MIGSTKGLPAGDLDRSDRLDHVGQLVGALQGEIVLRYATGRRVLDLGHGRPEIARWAARVSESLEVSPSASWRADAEGAPLVELPEAAFDLVLCLRTLPHLGADAASSPRAARALLEAAARATVPGGHVLVEIDNPRSLRGLALGIRNPITVVGTNVLRDDDHRLTRFDTLAKLASLIPPTLERETFFAARILVPFSTTLQVPLFGRLLARAEWWARDQALLRHFGAHLLVALRRVA